MATNGSALWSALRDAQLTIGAQHHEALALLQGEMDMLEDNEELRIGVAGWASLPCPVCATVVGWHSAACVLGR